MDESCGVTIQMKPLQQYFHMVLFIEYVVLTFEKSCGVNSVAVISRGIHSFQVVLTFEFMDEISWREHLNKTLQ